MVRSSGVEVFLETLETDAAAYFDQGKFNNLTDVGLTIGTILTSLIAAVVGATDVIRWVRVGMASVPAAITAIQKVTEVRGRSNWYFTYAARLRALAVTLEFAASPQIEDFAKKRAAIDLDMERQWSQVGRGGTKRK